MKNSINCELISGLEELDEIVVKNELENSFVLGMFADNLITGYWNSDLEILISSIFCRSKRRGEDEAGKKS